MKQTILLVDDSLKDSRSVKTTLKRTGLLNPLFVVQTAELAADYLSGKDQYQNRDKYPLPGVVLISLHLPECGALQFLHWLRQQPIAKKMLRIVLVQRPRLKEVVQAYDMGADSFLVKPVNEEDIKNLIRAFPTFWNRG